jgi:hypothetical protein
MKLTINFARFCELFEGGGRGSQFSRAGLRALYEHLADIETETGEEFELDVIAICGDYTEYDNLVDFIVEYGADYTTMDAIADETTVIYIPDTERFIVRVF